MVCGVRRIHRRHNVSMVSCTQLSAVLKGLTKAFILEHGAEALLPARREPLGPDLLRRLLRTPKGTVLGTARVDWNSTIFLCLGGMFALGGGTGFRKSEVALPSQTAFDDRRLCRTSVLWLIDGTLFNDPSAAQLRSLETRREQETHCAHWRSEQRARVARSGADSLRPCALGLTYGAPRA